MGGALPLASPVATRRPFPNLPLGGSIWYTASRGQLEQHHRRRGLLLRAVWSAGDVGATIGNRIMHLTVEQLRAAERGEVVRIEADGKKFVLLSQGVYEDTLDYSPWTTKEIDALADEALELVSNDGLDESDGA